MHLFSTTGNPMAIRAIILIHVTFVVVAGSVCGQDWITAPSYYTHDATGQRVQQYSPIGPFYVYVQPGYQRSGYHHTRSSMQFGGSVDHYHSVENWGAPVRPYDEWRFPYRPYSVPYDAWGPPYGGLGFGAFPFLPYPVRPPFQPGFGAGFPGNPGVGGIQPGLPYPGYQPWFDDRYPAFDDRAPFRHAPFPRVN